MSATFANAAAWVRDLVRATIRPRPKIALWKWADANIVIPEESGGPHPGPMRTSRFPIFRGLFDLIDQPHVHYVALCAGARVGKTLFSICVMLYWIAERTGSVAWLDPSGTSATKLVKNELEHFLRKCPAVWRLAVFTRAAWLTLWKTFAGKILRIVASGAEADMHGFNAELAIINELDRCRESGDDASSADKIIARTRLFPHTRLILENSTPGEGGEFSPIWKKFLAGSQHHCYLPCPHCSEDAKRDGRRTPFTARVGWSELSLDETLAGWQRLTFTVEKKPVPFDDSMGALTDERGRLLHRERWREETTGRIRFEQFATWAQRRDPNDATKFIPHKTGHDVDAIEHGATYECAHCQRDIAFVHLRWMLARYRWMAHNPAAPQDRISAHVWAGYSPFEGWGIIAKEFLESCHDVAGLIKFHNFTLGMPFVIQGAAIKEDDLDRVITRCSTRYQKGTMPMEAELLTMTVDKQKDCMWYSIRAWGIVRDNPDLPTWSALVDWGQAHSWNEILEIAGLRAGQDGHERRFRFTRGDGTAREYCVTMGLVDSGFEAESVYEFCLSQTEIFDPYKGGTVQMTRGSKVRETKVLNDQLSLWLCWSDYFAANLYFDCIRHGTANGRPINWWLPTDICPDYRRQLCDEYKGPDGWTTRTKTNHLGDTEKMHRALGDFSETILDNARDEVRASEKKAA